jgi:hypothetical protein
MLRPLYIGGNDASREPPDFAEHDCQVFLSK